MTALLIMSQDLLERAMVRMRLRVMVCEDVLT